MRSHLAMSVAVLLFVAHRAPHSAVAQELPFTCAASPVVTVAPPSAPGADPFGEGPWYVNADRTMWAVGGVLGVATRARCGPWTGPFQSRLGRHAE